MSVFEKLIKVNEFGDMVSQQWIEWHHISSGLIHCPICLVLNGCWFDVLLSPHFPLHTNCHCVTNPVNQEISNSLDAKCDISKFKDYIFSDKYAWNGKRDLFEKLGFTINDCEYLQKEYTNQALNNYSNSNYKLAKLDGQGQRININIKFNRNGRNIKFTSGWMVRPNGLITNNTPLAD